MNTEDDTFIKLSQPSIAEMIKLIDSYFGQDIAKFACRGRHFLESYHWTFDEFIVAQHKYFKQNS
jgi:hypothetical protein